MIPLVALLVLLTLHASPGDVVSINVTDAGTLAVSDSCMYFVDNLQPSINATPGEYELKVGINCTPGVKEVYADGKVLAQIEVNETTIDLQTYAADLEKENLALQREIENLQEQIKTLESQLEDLQNKAKMLEIQNGLQKQQIEELEKRLERANSELQEKRSDLENLEEKMRELNRQSSIYKLATFFLVSLFAGSFAALVFVARKE